MAEETKLTPVEKSIQKLDKDTESIVNKVIKENDPNEIKDLTSLFNQNIKKKNMLRLLKYNGLLDHVSDELMNRIENNPDEVTTMELMKLMDTINSSLEKTSKTIDGITDTPTIQINQQKVNVNLVDGLDKDSRDRVMDTVKQILELAKSQPQPVDEVIETIDTTQEGDI